MFKEEEIRPKEAERRANDLRLEDLKSFFYKNGKMDIGCFIEVPCIACGKESNNVEFEKEGFCFKRCDYCNTLYVSPRPNPKKLLEYYKNSKSIEYFTREILEKTKEMRKERIFKPRAEKIIKILTKLDIEKNVLVDIGGGNGLFLEVMKTRNADFKRYINIEPSEEGAKLTKEKGLEVANDFIENVDFDFEVSVITAFELVEHLFDPSEFIKKLNSLLRYNGIFILTTPNIEGFDLLLLGENSDNIGAPNHLNYFNPRSIKILLEKCGFEIIHIETPGVLDLNIVENKLNDGIEINDKFVLFLLEKDDRTKDCFQKFLMNNNLSSNMLVVARKRGGNRNEIHTLWASMD